MTETIPARGAGFEIGPLRHDVVVPQQDAVERFGGGFEIGAVLGENDLIDHRIDRRIFDADQIVGAGLVGRLRAPVAALLVAGRQRFRPRIGDDVEIPAAQPVLELRLIDGAHRDRHAEPFERWLVEQEDALEARPRREKFDGKGLAGLDVDELLVLDFVARLFEQPQRLAQIVAHRARIAVHRIGVRLLEQIGRHLVAHRFEEFELAAGRQAAWRRDRCRRNSCRCAYIARRKSACSFPRNRTRN